MEYSMPMPGYRNTVDIVSENAKKTQKIAALLATELESFKKRRAIVVALTGNLGSGKTTFAQGFARALGVREKILSPTFVLMKVYPVREKHRLNLSNEPLAGKMRVILRRHPAFLSNGVYPLKKHKKFKHLIHLDCYRLDPPREVAHLGLKKIFEEEDAVILIEWADRIRKLVPRGALWIRFEHGKFPSERIIKIL